MTISSKATGRPVAGTSPHGPVRVPVIVKCTATWSSSGDDRLDLLTEARERRVGTLDRLPNVLLPAPDEGGQVVGHEVLGEVLRDLVELPPVPDLMVDLEAELTVERRRRHWCSLPLACGEDIGGRGEPLDSLRPHLAIALGRNAAHHHRLLAGRP